MPFHKVVFTDIDGTLVDINTAEYGKKTNELIRIMKEKNIPLILTSAKTRLEQNKIREDLGLSDPFIVENGGAIVIPKGYFPDYALKDIEYTLRETQETEDEDRYANHDIRKDVRGMQQTKTINDNSKTDIPITAANLIVVEIGRSADHIRANSQTYEKNIISILKGLQI